MPNKETKKPLVSSAVIAAALLMGALVFSGCSFGGVQQVSAENGVVTIPVSKLADDKVHFYKFVTNGKEIRFFAAKASDGAVKTAFDACDSCFDAKKGYEQQGNKMNCRNCNQKFAIDRLGPNATGGCNPGYLPLRVDGSNITISAGDLANGARYF